MVDPRGDLTFPYIADQDEWSRSPWILAPCTYLTDITEAKLPAGDTIDRRSFAPLLRGRKGQPREWIFCHYDPRWVNFQFSRYAQDKRYKLYHDTALFLQ